MEVDHVGYLCRDINKSAAEFEKLGYVKITGIINDNRQNNGVAPRNVFLCFMQKEHYRIELVAPNGTEPSVITKQLEKQGEGPYHICYKAKDLTGAMQEMRANGWITVRNPEPALAFGDASVAFLFKNSVGLIELVEEYRSLLE